MNRFSMQLGLMVSFFGSVAVEMSLIATIRSNLFEALSGAFSSIDCKEFVLDVTPATQAQFGDYQCNSAMRLAKILAKSPRDIAATWVVSLQQMFPQNYARLEIAGPGFINIWLSDEFIKKLALNNLLDPRAGVRMHAKPQKVIVDFSSPNVAKEMHVGHLRSTVIGNAIACTLEFLGDDVLRLNHVGDWGTAFGMLIVYLQEQQPNVLTGVQQVSLMDLMRWYRASKECFDMDIEFANRARQAVVDLQAGSPEHLAAWQIICDISRVAYQEIYACLDIRITERGESFYNDMLEDTIKALDAAGLIEKSAGANCIFLAGFNNREGDPLPLMVQKSDGGFNYATTDMAAIRHRVTVEHAERIIYVTDAGQATHFAMVYAAAKQAGWVEAVSLEHVPFGLVLGADGKKFRTRSGDTEPLISLINEAKVRSRAIMQDKHPDWSVEEINASADTLGIASLKYADLSVNRMHDYVFSYDKMLSFEGNTASFIMYSYVRCRSILTAANFASKELIPEISLNFDTESERNLLVKLLQFSEQIEKVALELLPNRLTEYLFSLAEAFNGFFRDCRVLGDAQEQNRLLICALTEKVIRLGFGCLGIELLHKM
jgi:arginyl-tRNA synthetase